MLGECELTYGFESGDDIVDVNTFDVVKWLNREMPITNLWLASPIAVDESESEGEHELSDINHGICGGVGICLTCSTIAAKADSEEAPTLVHDAIESDLPESKIVSKMLSHALREMRLINIDTRTKIRIIKILGLLAYGDTKIDLGFVEQLFNGQTLSPITNRPEEWTSVGDQTWQSIRNPNLYSATAGATYWDVTEARSKNDVRLHTSIWME